MSTPKQSQKPEMPKSLVQKGSLNPPKPPVKIAGRTENRSAEDAQIGPYEETALFDSWGRIKGRRIPM